MTRIAVVGTMHSGKTTLANALVEQGFARLALADPLKDAACGMLTSFIYGFTPYFPDRWDALDGGRQVPLGIDRQEMEDGKHIFRPFLQWLGSEFAREYLKNNDCWLEMFRDMLDIRFCGADVVCDDVRFPNEAEYLRRLGFQIVRIKRIEEERLASVRSVSGNGCGSDQHLFHQSETAVESIHPDRTVYCASIAAIESLGRQLAAGD